MFKTLLRRALRNFGVEIARAKPCTKSSVEIQASLLPHAKVIFDVGAFIGTTVKEYRAAFPEADIYAFEPFPATFSKLTRILPNDPHFHPYNLALSDLQTRAVFYANQSPATNSLFPTAVGANKFWGEILVPQGTTKVQVSTIDAFCSDARVYQIDILKIDVQGAESRVLRGAETMLREGKILAVYTEIITVPTYDEQQSIEKIFELMSRFGFALYDIQNLLHNAGQLTQFDALFLRNLSNCALLD